MSRRFAPRNDRTKRRTANINPIIIFAILNPVRKIFTFYYDGFRSMTVGKKLWIIILIKLFILFFILRLIFFPDFLKSKFRTDQERSDYVREQLINRK